MHRYYKMLTMLTVLVVTVFATTSVVAANSAQDYAEAMQGFLPVVVDWTEDVQAAAHAAAHKPDQENLAELAELGARGEYILDDLRGTAALAPEPLQDAHWQLADAVGTLTVAAQNADQDAVGAADLIDGYLDWAEPSVQRIHNYVTRFGVKRPGDTPDLPGSES